MKLPLTIKWLALLICLVVMRLMLTNLSQGIHQYQRASFQRKIWVGIVSYWQQWCLCEWLCSLSFHIDPSHLPIISQSLHDLSNWKDLGLKLKMEYSFLDGIESDNGGDTEMCKTAMLHCWLQSGRATKSSLVTALGMIGEDAMAAKIEWIRFSFSVKLTS